MDLLSGWTVLFALCGLAIAALLGVIVLGRGRGIARGRYGRIARISRLGAR